MDEATATITPSACWISSGVSAFFEQFVAVATGDDAPEPARLSRIAAEHGIDIVGPPRKP